MKKCLNTIFVGLMFFNIATTQSDTLDTLITSLEKKVKIIKTIGDFDGNGTKEVAVDSGKGGIDINNLQSIHGVNGCDSLYVIKKDNKKDFLIIHYKDGTMEKAEYYPEDKFWSRIPYKK